ncbi:hypothetical protein GALL_506890 [mine drainage metagenome]|uniref:Uncharacterized protein n=1 Tax=mine drainage metagenome TaxID=410659 RepID=A0A1J5P824_9ZZZZ
MCDPVEFVREHVDQHLGVGLCVDVPVIEVEQVALERHRIGQVAVVRQHQTEGRIHIERLRLRFAFCIACGGVTHLTDAVIARQRAHIAGTKHIAHHAACLVHEQLRARSGHDARRILPAMLQQEQRVVEQLVDGLLGNHTDDAAHGRTLSSDREGAHDSAQGQMIHQSCRQPRPDGEQQRLRWGNEHGVFPHGALGQRGLRRQGDQQ